MTNRENELITKENIKDRKFFFSRSVAIAGIVLFFDIVSKQHYILLGKRGKGCPDEVGKLNIPCGYLDWDESAAHAFKREVFEETGLNIDKLWKSRDYNFINDKEARKGQPWFVNSEPKFSTPIKQNVTLYFGLEIVGKILPDLSTENSELNEVENVNWYLLDDILEKSNKEKFAFNHYKRIIKFINHIKS